MGLRQDKWLGWTVGYAALVCALALMVAQWSVTLCDGNTYFSMARAMAERGAFDIPNGFDVVRSVELHPENAVLVDGKLIGKYPPLYALLAVPFYRAFGLPGLIAMNAVSLGVVVLLFFLLARRVMDERFAFGCGLLLPFATPLFFYAVILMPHLLAAAVALGSFKLAMDAARSETPRGAFLWSAGAGLCGGVALGVRVQELIWVAVLAYVLAREARQRRAALLGMLAGLAPVVGLISALNYARFSTANPISYGPAGAVGGPIDLETTAFLLHRPGLILVGAALGGLLLAVALTRSHPRRWLLRLGASLVVALLCLIPPSAREASIGMAQSTMAMLGDASNVTYGTGEPLMFHGLVVKGLLQASPVLVLGLGGMLWYGLRRAPLIPAALGKICLLTIGFLATRHLRISELGNVLGYGSFGARYLVELYAPLFLLTCLAVSRLTVSRRFLWGGLLLGALVFWTLAWSAPEINPRAKVLWLLYGSLGLATLLAAGYGAWHRWGHAGLLSAALAVTVLYGAAVTVTQDTRRVVSLMQVQSEWYERMESALPQRYVLVGWGMTFFGVYPVRENRVVIMVDAARDEGEDLPRVLDAFEARGLPLYYFGLELERVRPLIESRYHIRPVLTHPLVWKLERKGRR